MCWVYLFLGGLFEIAFAVSLKMMDGHKHLYWSISFYSTMLCSFYFIHLALKSLPLGTVYAIWTGMGTAGVAIIGYYFFGEEASILRILFLMLLIISIMGLKLTTNVS